MKNVAALSILFQMIPLSVCSQSSGYYVRGELRDSLLDECEPYATIRIERSGDTLHAVKLAVTDAEGRFSEKIDSIGRYRILISSVGKKPIKREFYLSDTDSIADLGVLYTREESELLKGVEIVVQKPLVKSDPDKITYSIENDPDSKTSTTMDMLRKVPMVTVDGEDNIKVKGSSSFKIYVNGKPNAMMSTNPKEVLKSLPANSVKEIEVITEPGTKYDAEGIGGILNIVTVGGRMSGYTATLGTSAGNNGFGGYGYGTVQLGKFMLAGSYGINKHVSPESYSSGRREDYTSDENAYLDSERRQKYDGTFQYGYVQGSYEIDTLNLVTFSTNFYSSGYSNRSTALEQMFSRSMMPVYSYGMNTDADGSYTGLTASADYQHSFKRKGRFLTLSYKFDYNPNNSNSETEYVDVVDVPFDLKGQYYDNDAHTEEHTVQLDYVDPISDMHYVDAGVKYIYRMNQSDGKYYKDNGAGELVQDMDMSTKYGRRQDILAAYADYQLKWNDFGAKAGVRFEHTFMDIEYELHPERDYDAGFDDLVPSLVLSYSLGQSSSLKLGYNMRINRPDIWYLNPFRDTSNPTSVSYGNPDLDTEKSHNMNLTFNTFASKFSMNASLNYRFADNGIEAYSFIEDGIMNSTYGNVGKSQELNLYLWMNWNPWKKTRFSLNANGAYVDNRSKQLDAHNYGFTGGINGNIQQTLPWDVNLSFYGGAGSPYISLQGRGAGYYYYGINVNKSFLKDKRLTVTLYARNIFNKYRTYSNTIDAETFKNSSKSRIYQLSWGVSVNWRFGKLESQVKRTNRSINNDDVKSGGGGDSGSGK